MKDRLRAPGAIYVCDTNALIDLHRHFPTEFGKLRKSVAEGMVKVPEGVYRELRRRSDKLRKRIERWARDYSFVVYIGEDQRLREELTRIERAYGESIPVGDKGYPGFWKSASGKKAVDGEVVAVAKVLRAVVVSDDRAVRLASMWENVECVGWSEFARRAGIQQDRQLDLL